MSEDYLKEEDQDAKRYQWLKENIIEVLCDGRPSPCYTKYMLPRLVCVDSSGRHFSFDEIIDIQRKRSDRVSE